MQLNRDTLRHHWRGCIVVCILILVMIFLGYCLAVSPVWPLQLKLIVFAIGAIIIAGFTTIIYVNEHKLRTARTLTTTEIPIVNERNVQIPPMPQSPPTVRAKKFWNLQKTKQLLVFVFGSLVVFTVAPIMELAWWQIVSGIAGVAMLMFLANAGQWYIHKATRFTRRVFARLLRQPAPTPNDVPPPEKHYYDERPHFTMFFNHTILQITVWVVVLLGGVYILHDIVQAPTWLNALLQAWVTLINTYFIIRAHLQWNGTMYTVTENNFVITRTEDLFFWIRRQSEYLDKGRFVGKTLAKRKIIEHILLHNRRSVVLELQDVKRPSRIVRYVKRADTFIASMNAAA